MSKPRLTERQALFIEYCMQYYTFRTHTDAYLAVYSSKGSRRTATANASRIYNKPAVKAYRQEIEKLKMRRAIELQKQDRGSFLERLKR